MNIRRTFIALAVLVRLIALPLAARAETDRGQQLFDIFLNKLRPESAIFQLSEPPREDGFIAWAYLECKNANIRGMNIRNLTMDCYDALVTPPEQWAGMEHPRVQRMLACHAEGLFTEQDINDFLASRVFGHDKEWENISVRMTDDRIRATAYYNANIKIMRLRIRLDLSCRIVGRGTALWLEDVELKVNRRDVSTSLVRKALDKLQPFIDMKKYNLPLYLTKIECEDGICRVSSRIAPKPVTSGLQWSYPSGDVGKIVKEEPKK